MIDETNACAVEPEGTLKFKSPKLLLRHVHKHVLDGKMNRPGEKWRKVEGFDSRLIRMAQQGQQEALETLCKEYLRMINNVVAQKSAANIGHRHIFSILRNDLPPALLEMLCPDGDRKARQTIKFWDEHLKLVIIIVSNVRNEEFTSYRIKTAYRTEPHLKLSSWLKFQLTHEEDKSNLICNSRKMYILADHMG